MKELVQGLKAGKELGYENCGAMREVDSQVHLLTSDCSQQLFGVCEIGGRGCGR